MKVVTERPRLPHNVMAQTGPTIIHAYNVLDSADREVFRARTGSTLSTTAPITRQPVICVLNGECVHPEDWNFIDLEDSDHACFMTLPQGGGGDSNSLLQVIGVVLIVVGVLYSMPNVVAAGAVLLASGLLPPPPSVPIAINNGTVEQSPTYNISLGGNQARLGQAIPVVYGRHILTPDFAAVSYTEFDAVGDQYYYALFCIGAADAQTIESVTIDDTVLEHFVSVETQYIGPSYGSALTLMDPAVVNAPEVASQELIYGTYVGPFASSGAGLLTYKIGIDIVCPKGLYFANNDGTLSPKTVTWLVEIRPINDAGAVAGIWSPLGFESLTLAQSSVVRRTYTYTVPPGRYQVRLQRQEAKDTNARAGHEINWAGLRSYIQVVTPLEPAANYLAVKIKATNQLSGLSQRKFALIIRRQLPTWNPLTGWSAPVETRSIAWALADVLRNQDYGGQFSDTRIDLETLYELDQVWSARGDYFNGVFDNRTTIWEALTRIARCGRAKPVLRGNVVTFVRDQSQDLPVALFNMRNIVRGSFSISYRIPKEDDPDGIILEFFDERTWASNYVTMPLPGVVGEPIKPARISVKGITNLKQAQRETAYMVADSVYRPTSISFTTEMEGFLPALGDLIAVSHDVAGWGVSGEIESYGYPFLMCTENLPWSVGANYVVLVDEYGDMHGPYSVTPGPYPRSMRLAEAPAFVPYAGTDRERTRFAMGPASAYAKMCKVLSISPASDDSVQITAVVDDERVHNSDLPFAGDGSVSGGGTGGGGSGGGSGGGRRAKYTPDGLSNYNAASDEQRGRYGYFTDEDRTVGTANDPGYVYST